jgi:heme-degrading monooxygenase HmoA
MTDSPSSIYKIDRFSVPQAALPAFIERLRAIQQQLEGQPGCLQNLVLTGSNTSDDMRELVTVVQWESEQAFAAARAEVGQRYVAQGFDPKRFMQQHSVNASLGEFRPLAAP